MIYIIQAEMNKKISCIIVDDEKVARDILERHLSKLETVSIKASCKSAIEAFEAMNRFEIDLVFLDINMPEISGLSLARAIGKDTRIIFTTAYREYALDGFDLQAVDYLLKPISFERLMKALNKYIGETNYPSELPESPSQKEQRHFFVRADRKMVRINFDDIQYVESIGDYIRIHLESKGVITRETIGNIQARLPKNEFIRVHRSFLVAKDSIESYTSEVIETKLKEIPISRTYKEEVLKILENSVEE